MHGDYDADGVCATALACEVLRRCGANVEPFLPSRFDEGYGLAVETVERLHEAEGCGLLRDGRLRHHGGRGRGAGARARASTS